MTRSADWPLAGPGIWLWSACNPPSGGSPALFLDRDGVVIDDTGFVSDPDSVVLAPGAAALIATANRAGVPVAVVTNQSGIDRGLFGWAEFAAVQAELERRLAAAGTRLDGVAACPFHPDHTPGYGPEHARWRKPGPGMIEALGDRLGIDLPRSWLVGDRARDIEAARAAGLRGGVLLSPPDGGEAIAVSGLATPEFHVHVVADIDWATRFLRPWLEAADPGATLGGDNQG